MVGDLLSLSQTLDILISFGYSRSHSVCLGSSRMTEEERKKASVIADLVSVEDWEKGLTPGQQMVLKEEVGAAFPEAQGVDLKDVHKNMRNIVMGLLRGGKATIPLPVMV